MSEHLQRPFPLPQAAEKPPCLILKLVSILGMEEERIVTVSYLAKIAGVKEETVWRDVKELRAIIEQGPLEWPPNDRGRRRR